LPFLASAQLREVDNELIVFDTIKHINTVKSLDWDITIHSADYSVRFNRKFIIEAIDDILIELKSSDDSTKWLLRHIERINSVKDFFSKNQNVEWDNYWKEDEPISIDSIKDGEPFAKAIFQELACPSLENGQFKLNFGSRAIHSIIQTSAYINGLGAIVFITEDSQPFWMCPPFTID
jgi:hypothetical protein